MTGIATETTDENGLTKDTLFHLLENRRRRWTIRYLKRRGGRAELGDLAEQVAAWENGITPNQVTSNQRKRIYTSLQQRHVPQLDEAGVVDFDQNRGSVEVTSQMQELDVYLEVVPERTVPWSVYYLGLGTASCVLIGLLAVIEPFDPFPDLGWAALIGVTFTVSAAVHTYRSNSIRTATRDVPPEVENDS